jgi:hypothetical protein
MNDIQSQEEDDFLFFCYHGKHVYISRRFLYYGLGNVREKARLTSVGLPHAGDWLNVIPSPTLGLHMRAAEFVVSVKYRLGVPVFPKAGQCPACNHHSDVLGDHAFYNYS